MAELAGSALATGQKSSARMCSNRLLFFQSIHFFVDHPVQPIPFSSPQHRLQGEHVGLEPRRGRYQPLALAQAVVPQTQFPILKQKATGT